MKHGVRSETFTGRNYIKEIKAHAKDFLIEFEGDRYDIYATDFKQNDRQYVQLKANRRD